MFIKCEKHLFYDFLVTFGSHKESVKGERDIDVKERKINVKEVSFLGLGEVV